MSQFSMDYEKVCRLCLTKEQDVHLKDSMSKELKYWEMFTGITGLQYSLFDGLPQSICRMCASQLANINIFKERCLSSNKILIDILGETKVTAEYLDDEIEEKYHPEEFDLSIVKEDESNDAADYVEDVREEEEPATITKTIRIKRHSCKQCGVLVESPSKLIKHLMTHLVENNKIQQNAKLGRVFSCRTCCVAFLKINHLRTHILGGRCKKMPGALVDGHLPEDNKELVVKDENDYKCHICSNTHKSTNELQEHLIKTHRKSDPLLCCIRCPFSHQFPDDMILHYRNNKNCDTMARCGEKKTHHTCDICKKHFRYQCDLRKHIESHRQVKREKLFECDICSTKFTRKAEISIHKRAHFNIKPYMCQECGICFSRSSNLARHRQGHTGVANYPCPVCQRRFKTKFDMNAHMNSHTGNRPFKCRLCPKAYTSQGGLHKHYRHHPNIKKTSRRVEPVTK